jgi:hypothetical protein
VFNAVLRSLGLPAFALRRLASTIGDHGGERLRVGPVLSQVHVTRNLICGHGGDRPFLDWLSAQSFGRLPYQRTHDTTVTAGRLDRRQHALYAKGPEIQAHALKWRRARSPEKMEVKDEATAYLAQLAHWCDDNGVIRDEVKLGRKWLQESPYRFPENWNRHTAAKLHKANSEVKTMNAGAMSDYGVEVRKRLIEAGISDRQAGLMANAVSGWLAGQVSNAGLGRSQRYSYLKALREHCGLELRRPCNVRALATCVKPKVLEVRELELADLPVWYRWPEQRAVA